jgi:CheY-like chemotaxis protein
MLGQASLIGLVEDSDEDFVAFVRLARKEVPGVEIVRWTSAEELLREGEAGAPRPDVIVADLNLPGIDGAELVRRLRAAPQTRSIPVFVLSGSERQRDIDRCYAAGANAYLTKPGSLVELRALVRMLFRTMSTFKAPSPVAVSGPDAPRGEAGEGEEPAATAAVDQEEIDAARDAYEAELRGERDRERAARERAEALQRLTARLANVGDERDVERELVDALTERPGRPGVRIVTSAAESEIHAPMFMPDPFGAGTIAMFPLVGHAGARHGTLRVHAPLELGEDDEAFLHAAVSLTGQALARVGRLRELAHRARTAAADLPSAQWWAAALEGALARSRRSGQSLTLVVVLPRDQDRFDEQHGPVQGDARLLALLDGWRAVGIDLISPSGAERWVALVEGTLDEAGALASEVIAALGGLPTFVWGAAQWDRREDGEALLFRAATAVARAADAA